MSTGLFQLSITPPSKTHPDVYVAHYSSQSIFPVVTLFNSDDNLVKVDIIFSFFTDEETEMQRNHK